MAEVDTSSYPKNTYNQSSVLDTAKKFGDVEQQGISINQAKLKQINDQFNLMNAELATLANDPNATKEQAASKLLTLANTFGFKPEVTQHMLGELKSAPSVQAFAETALVRGKSTLEKTNFLYGQNQIYSQGQQDTPVVVSPKFGMRPTGAPIQRQIPPNQPVIGPDNRETLQGPTAPVAPPGIATGPGRLPVARSELAPAVNPNSTVTLPANSNALPISPDTVPASAQVQSRFPAPSGPAVGQSPLFEEGKKAYTEDQALATQKLTALKPLLAAVDLMKDLRSGPGTESWNKAVAFMKANNIIRTETNDPTAVYQEVNKYLNQYVSQNGTRSDADLAQREMSNPNVSQQINPALLKLTKSTIAQDRIQAARAGSWEGGNKLEEYGKHRSQFPAKMDPRAFNIDKLEDDERQSLLGDMLKKKNTPEGKRFWQSLEAAKKSGVLGIN